MRAVMIVRGAARKLGLGRAVIGIVVGSGCLAMDAGPLGVVDLPMVFLSTQFTSGVLASCLLFIGESAKVPSSISFGVEVVVTEGEMGLAYGSVD